MPSRPSTRNENTMDHSNQHSLVVEGRENAMGTALGEEKDIAAEAG